MIQVKIHAFEYMDSNFPDGVVYQRLRQAGIPAVLSPRGVTVERGKLLSEDIPSEGVVLYSWEEK